jgi:hypothetical protein
MSIVGAVGNTLIFVVSWCRCCIQRDENEAPCSRTLWTVFALTATVDLFLSLNMLCKILLLTSCSYNMDTKLNVLGGQRT